MKWIGQLIYDQTSRFRNDVYLEGIATGTIASGSNLGLDSNNKIVKATVSGGGTPTDITVADESTDTTCFPLFVTAATGDLGPKTASNLTFDSNAGVITATGVTASGFIGDLQGDVTGDVSGNIDGSSGTCTGNAATATTLATTRAFQTDLASTSSANFNGSAANTHGVTGTLALGNGGTGQTSAQAAMNALAGGTVSGKYLRANGSNVVLSAIQSSDIGTLNQNTTGSSGSCTGQAATVATITGLAPDTATTQAAQGNITSLGTLTVLQVDDINLNAKTLKITGDTSDIFSVTAGANGATTLATVDDAGTAGHLTFDPDGDIILDTAGASANNGIILKTNGTQFGDFNVHHSNSYLTLYEAGGTSLADYLQISVAAAGATTIKTVDGAEGSATAHLDFAIDGHFSVASTGIDIATNGTISSAIWQGDSISTTYTDAKVTSIVAGDGIDVSGATGNVTVTAETASVTNPGAVELATTDEADTGTDTARAVTPEGLKSHVDLRYSYVYMTWSASATSSMDGSDPEWVFPNAAKGIYEEDWTKDENIKATSVGTTTYTTSRHTTVNALVVPHTGVCVGFHAHGRNNNNDNNDAFKAGLFHYEGSSDGTNASGIDYGATGTTHECTLRWIATAAETEASGGADGTSSHNFKGPCKLVSNDDALAVSAGDALLPAIMGPDGSDEIFVTMTIILKIPLTT